MVPRPISVTLIAIFGLIWAGLLLCMALPGVVMLATGARFGPPNPAMDALLRDPVYIAVSYVSFVLILILTAVLVAGCIGSFSLRPWARTAMLTWAVAYILFMTASTIYTGVYVLPATLEAMNQTMHGPGSAAAMSIARVSAIVGAVIGAILPLILPVCVLIFYNRPKAVNAFRGLTDTPQGFFPAQP